MADKSGDGSASAAGVSFSLKASATAKRRQRKPMSGDDEGAEAAKRHKGEVIAALEGGSAVDAQGLTDEQRAERKRKEAELVIPLPTSKPWTKQQQQQQQPSGAEDGANGPTKEPAAETAAASREDGAAPMSLEEEAVAALIKEAAAAQAGPRGEGEVEVGDIPLLMKNRIPGMESAANDGERFRVDVNVRPTEPGEGEYERVPVEAFGAALLRGMGWKKGEAIGGTNKGLIEPVEFVPRAKGLGLGARVNSELRPETHKRRTIKPGDSREAPKQMEARRADGSVKHVRGLSEQLQEVEDLALKRGSFVAIERGPHSGHVGTAQRIYSRGVDVKLGISSVVVTVQEDFLRTVRRADYQEMLAELRKHGRRTDGSGPTDKGREQRTNTDQERGDAAKHKPRQAEPTSSTSTERRTKVWVHPNIRVRIVSDSYGRGRYYNTKVRVLDVLSKDNITCVDSSSRILEDLRQRYLETVVPKIPEATVLVLAGEFAGQRARLMERDNKRSRVVVQVVGEAEVLQLEFDDVAEYLGDTHSDDW